jgi:D-alanyl-lipoteichoic acid acyltransferase DltB (MBOAT superfamily)
MADPEKKWPLRTAVLINIFNLGFFKYFYFFNKVLADATGYPFFAEIPSMVKIALPMAISFYSFQMIAAAVDSAKNPPEKPLSALDFGLFVIFFPVLIAGPIMRFRDFLPNLSRLTPDPEKLYRACYLMMNGLVKKVLIADPLSTTIAPVFSYPGNYDSFSLLMGGICYAIQVYCDFSGLTDMARSVALFLGFEIPENFKAPFFSTSGRELWRRWHITLSFWLREYIYIPLGGSRVNEYRGYLNLIITMTLGGFWHGADYTFVVWGFYWGLILALERFWEEKRKNGFASFLDMGEKFDTSLPVKIGRALFVFLLFSISGIMFRSNSATHMIEHFIGLFSRGTDYLVNILDRSETVWVLDTSQLVAGSGLFRLEFIADLERVLYGTIAILIFHWFQYFPESLQRFRKYDSWLMPVAGVITIFLLTMLSQDGGEFIYYKF